MEPLRRESHLAFASSCLSQKLVILFQYSIEAQRRHAAVDVAVDLDHGGERAAPETSDPLKIETLVRRRLAQSDAEPFLDGAGQTACPANVARRAQTHPDRVPSRFDESKLGIEGGDSEDLTLGDSQEAGDHPRGLFRNESETSLDPLEEGYEVTSFSFESRKNVHVIFVSHRKTSVVSTWSAKTG
jgi:hypothetical protein